MSVQRINFLLQQAIEHLQQGRVIAAEKMLDDAKRINPRHADVLHLLGLVYKSQGKSVKAISFIRKAIKINKKVGVYHRNLGLIFAASGKNSDSIGAFKRAILYDSNDVSSHNDLAVVYGRVGRIKDAISEYKKAIDKSPEYAEAYANLGNLFAEMFKYNDAIEQYDKAIDLKYDNANIYYNRGNALSNLRKTNGAVESYKKAIECDPSHVLAYYNYGNLLKKIGDYKEALYNYNKAVSIQPEFAGVYNNIGNVYSKLGDVDRAKLNYHKSISLDSGVAQVHYNYANVLKDIGEIDAAVEEYNTAIQLKPDFVEAYYNRGNALIKYKSDDPYILMMENLYNKASLTDYQDKQLCFSLAKAYGDIGNYDDSFNYVVKGNSLHNKDSRYDITVDQELFANIKEIFTEVGIGEHGYKHDSIKPIFIVGMPRSGTSLVEQIIASHHSVYGAGELELMSNVTMPVVSEVSDKNNSLPEEKIAEIHDRYIGGLDQINTGKDVITDKMPLNFRWIGFIISALPEAKIIHLNRDARAVCWSIYKHFFSGAGNGYAYDLNDLVEYYKLYDDLMSFWRERFPGCIYDLNYEKLTEDQEGETRMLLEYCGLGWDDHCMDFHDTKRSVKTSSASQVREKMYKGSSDEWRIYEGYLHVLTDALN